MQTGAIAAIDSVLSQNIETNIILVDDCSSPALTLPKRLRSLNNIVQLKTEKNSGAGSARNLGVENCATEWISFLDSDDTLLPNTLRDRFDFAQSQFAVRGNNALLIFACGWNEPFGDGAEFRIRIPNPANSAEQFSSGCWYCPGSCIIAKRTVFLDHRFDPELRRLEDFDMSIRLGLSGAELITMPLSGVEITPSGTGTQSIINMSTKSILTKHIDLAVSNPALWKLIRAYLWLELSSAHFRETKFVSAVVALARSLAIKPRLKRHFSPGWKYNKPDDVT